MTSEEIMAAIKDNIENPDDIAYAMNPEAHDREYKDKLLKTLGLDKKI